MISEVSYNQGHRDLFVDRDEEDYGLWRSSFYSGWCINAMRVVYTVGDYWCKLFFYFQNFQNMQTFTKDCQNTVKTPTLPTLCFLRRKTTPEDFFGGNSHSDSSFIIINYYPREDSG